MQRLQDTFRVYIWLELCTLIVVAPPAMSSLTEVNLTRADLTWYKLNNLDNETTYILYVWATTRIGRGAVAILTERTMALDCKYSRITAWTYAALPL